MEQVTDNPIQRAIYREAFTLLQAVNTLGTLVEKERELEERQKALIAEARRNPPVPPEINERYKGLGFTSAGLKQELEYEKAKREYDERVRNVYYTDEYIHAEGKLQRIRKIRLAKNIIQAAHSVMSTDVVLLPFEAFENILIKNKLTCGLFSEYTGDIPEKNLDEIMQAQKAIKKLPLRRYIKEMAKDYYYREILPPSKEWDDAHRFPFHESVPSDFKDLCTYLFICAPEEAMGGITNRDPLICAYTDAGILIFSAWGEEAEDPIVHKFMAFEKTIADLWKGAAPQITESFSSIHFAPKHKAKKSFGWVNEMLCALIGLIILFGLLVTYTLL